MIFWGGVIHLFWNINSWNGFLNRNIEKMTTDFSMWLANLG